MSLVTLAQIKGALKAESPTPTQEAELIRHGVYVTKRWGDVVGMDFEPRKKAWSITPNGRILSGNGRLLRLPAPLLELSTITVGGTALTYNTDVLPFQEDTANPIGYLLLADTYCCDWYPCNVQTYLNSIVIDGWWGYRTNYTEEGWINSGDANTAAITTTTATTFAVTSATGLDGLYRTPRFSPGNLLKLDSEIMVIDNITTNTLTVRRGQRGTTAATHLISTPIYTWNPEPDVVDMLAKAACYKFASKGVFQEVQITDLAAVTYPIDMPREFYSVAQEYAYGY